MKVLSGPATSPAVPAVPSADSAAWRRTALATGAAALVAVGALAATVVMRAPTGPAVTPAPAVASTPEVAPVASADAASAPAFAPIETPPVARASGHPRVPRTVALVPARASADGSAPALRTQPVAMVPATVCASCGVVESVTAVTHKGEGSGLGAVAGGVLGGVVGHQVGGGGGRTAMTVLGAIGGGLAGNEIERRQRATTDYRVTVRLADGSLHSVTQAHAPAIGQAVRIDGRQLVPINEPPRSAPQGSGSDGDGRTLQTAARG